MYENSRKSVYTMVCTYSCCQIGILEVFALDFFIMSNDPVYVNRHLLIIRVLDTESEVANNWNQINDHHSSSSDYHLKMTKADSTFWISKTSVWNAERKFNLWYNRNECDTHGNARMQGT